MAAFILYRSRSATANNGAQRGPPVRAGPALAPQPVTPGPGGIAEFTPQSKAPSQL
jgi:hypothetical protein